MAALTPDALIEQLNALLEAERAGALVGAGLVTDTEDPELNRLAHLIREDEMRWSACWSPR